MEQSPFLPLLAMLFLLGLWNSSCSSSPYESPRAYNDTLITLQNRWDKQVAEYFNQISLNKAIDVKTSKKLATQLEKDIQDLKKRPAYEGGEEFKQETIKMLEVMHHIFKEDVPKLAELVNDGITEEETSKVAALMDTITGRYQEQQTQLIKAQKAFAEKHNLIITSAPKETK